jgi:SAM-dependent methyltransferase
VASEHSESEHDALWRGIDLSGITVVLGVGEGRLVETLATQARASVSGHVLSVGLRVDDLIRIRYMVGDLPASFVAARPRAIPLQDGSVDLLVMSGTLRQVPVSSLHTLFEEIWRVLVPGGQLRIADIIEPSEAHYNEAWRQRNALITKLAEALNRPTALYANLKATAEALNTIGFENLAVSLLPGYPLTDAWLDATEEAVLGMVSRVADPDLRESILEYDLPRLIRAYRSADQRATERFVLRGTKVGNLALDMEASFIEDDLVEDDDD